MFLMNVPVIVSPPSSRGFMKYRNLLLFRSSRNGSEGSLSLFPWWLQRSRLEPIRHVVRSSSHELHKEKTCEHMRPPGAWSEP
jgi:hypothetical protein